MEKFNSAVDKAMRCIMAIAMLSLVVVGTWQIFTRWILNDPSTWSDEFMRYMLIIASMIGAGYCFYTDKHLALDLLSSKAKGPVKTVLTVFQECCILFFVIYVFIYGGGRMAMGATNVSSVMHIPFRVLYMILPITGFIVVLGRVIRYISLIQNKGGKK